MTRRLVVLIIAVVVIVGCGLAWWFGHAGAGSGPLVLSGNIDLRQADLAFIDSGRIAAVLVDEGAVVKQGQVIARLDTSRLLPQIAAAEAQVAAQTATVQELHNGSRPEEVAQATANVAAAKADADNTRLAYSRLSTLSQSSTGSSVTESQVDAARAAMDSAKAQFDVAQQTLALALAGPRAEDVAKGEAQLRATTAQVDLLNQQLKDADLAAPADGIIRSRLLEPGEIASPQRPVFSLAIVTPKWVRAYVSEPSLTDVKPGMDATVTVDGDQGRSFTGHVGFISPVAEFTPQSIQTTELRTSLVYEVRVLVDDPDDVLRLGMPATVTLGAQPGAAAPAKP